MLERDTQKTDSFNTEDGGCISKPYSGLYADLILQKYSNPIDNYGLYLSAMSDIVYTIRFKDKCLKSAH